MTDAKAELRAVMRSRRKALKAMHPHAAAAAAAHAPAMLKALPFAPVVVALYQPMGAELDTAPLADVLRVSGLMLALPRVAAANAPLTFHLWTPGDPLAPDLQRCMAPLPDAPTVDPDVVIVPLLAFDARGGRLGQGGGYYDRTLEQLAFRSPRGLFVGMAYAGQAVERIPDEDHDQKLDGVLTERGYMPAQKDI